MAITGLVIFNDTDSDIALYVNAMRDDEWENSFRPDRNISGKRIPPKSHVEEREDVNTSVKSSMFNLNISVGGDSIRTIVDQQKAKLRDYIEVSDVADSGRKYAIKKVSAHDDLFGEILTITVSYNNFSFNPAMWMTDIRSKIMYGRIAQLCLVGSNGAVVEDSTRASMLDLLNNGVRYFDIRPFFVKGEIFCGRDGYPLFQVINEINKFTENKREIIILDFTEGYNEDARRDLNLNDWLNFFSFFEKIKCRHKIANYNNSLLIERIDALTKDGSCVIMVTRKVPEGTRVPDYIAYSKNVPLVGNPTNTGRMQEMFGNQMTQMYDAYEHSYKGEKFVLSWFLNKHTKENAYKALQKLALNSIGIFGNRTDLHPFIILLDDIRSSKPAETAVQITDKVFYLEPGEEEAEAEAKVAVEEKEE